jgi:hypothetical protein
MSDGPHRCLPRRKAWKEASFRADRAAFAPDEIAHAVEPALTTDWSKDVSSDLIAALDRCFGGGEQMSLLAASPEALRALRPLVVGSPLGSLVLDCADQVAAEGLNGTEAMERVVTEALSEWGCRGVRQIEEHYCREANERRGFNVRTRLEIGISRISFPDMARQILGAGRPPIEHRPTKATGLDDGVYF